MYLHAMCILSVLLNKAQSMMKEHDFVNEWPHESVSTLPIPILKQYPCCRRLVGLICLVYVGENTAYLC